MGRCSGAPGSPPRADAKGWASRGHVELTWAGWGGGAEPKALRRLVEVTKPPYTFPATY